MRRRSGPASFLALLLAATIMQPVQQAAADPVPAPWVWTEDGYTNVFSDSRPSASAGRGLRLDTARNEYEGAQVVVRRDSAFTIEQVTFTDLVSGGDRIGAANLEYKFVENTFLDANSILFTRRPEDRVYPVTRQAPADFPDGLSNKRSWPVPARTTQAVWIRLFVPAATPGGLYRGSVTVVTSAGSQLVPVEVDVRPVTVPDPADGGFTNTMWSVMFGELDTGGLAKEPIEEYYGLQRYSPGWWELMGNLAKERKAHRTNNLTVPMMRVLVDGQTRFNHGTGQYEFGWQRFDEVVRFFLERGAVKRIEAFLWSGNWRGGSMEIIHPDTNRPAWVGWDSVEGVRWHNQYIKALKEHLEQNGWANRFWMHIGDEPVGPEAEDAWLRLADRIRAVWPDVKIGDAAFHEPSGSRLARRANIMIPNLQNYSSNPQVYDEERAKGKELWLYTCNIPTTNYLNRFIDQPQWHQRQLMWMAASRGVSGHLHWAMDKWMYRLNQAGPDDQDYQKEKGDGYIVLPDKEFRTIRSTVRYEAQRDGIEDWEVLHQLGRVQPTLARELAAGVVPNGHVFTPDTDHMIRMRRIMLDLAAGRTTPDLARAGIATASSGDATKAIDGDPTTAWQPTGGSGWLQVDLGRQAHLDALRLRWSGNPPAGLVIKQSADGVRWTQVKAASTLTVLNTKARYLRIETGGALAAIEAIGTALTQPNLALGRSYTWSEAPAADLGDTGIEATDGFFGDAWDDGRTVGFTFGPGVRRDVGWQLDLGSVRQLGRVRVKAYEEYPAYRPDQVRVLTSVDGKHFTSRAVQLAPRGTAGIWYDLEFGAVPARHVKVVFTKTGSADADKLFVDDVEVYGAVSSAADLAWGRSYTLSASPDGSYPDSGFESTDGDAAGAYGDGLGYGFPLEAGERKTVDVGIDLGGLRSISRVEVAAYDDAKHDYAPSSVQVLVNGTVVAESVLPVGGWYRLEFPAVSSERVAVRVVKSHGEMADWLFLDEIRVLGAARTVPVASYQVPAPAAGHGDSGSESTDAVLAGHYSDGLSYGYDVPSGSKTVNLELDLGAVTAVDWVKLREYHDGDHDYAPDQVVLSTSSDRTTWTERARTNTARAYWFDLTFSPVQARYLRLQLTKSHGNFADHLFLDEAVVHSH